MSYSKKLVLLASFLLALSVTSDGQQDSAAHPLIAGWAYEGNTAFLQCAGGTINVLFASYHAPDWVSSIGPYPPYYPIGAAPENVAETTTTPAPETTTAESATTTDTSPNFVNIDKNGGTPTETSSSRSVSRQWGNPYGYCGADVTKRLRRSCHGKQYCQITVSTAYFGFDPCYYWGGKKLDYYYNCIFESNWRNVKNNDKQKV